MNRAFRNCCGALALLLAATGAAAAQDDKDKKAVSVSPAPAAQAPGTAGRAVEEVFFQIRTPGTGEQLAFLRPGEVLNIRAGTQIELFAVARPTGGRDRDLFRPKARFSLPNEDRNEVQILEVEEARGEVTLRALNVDPQRRQDATLHWQILEPIQARRRRRSSSSRRGLVPRPRPPRVTSVPAAALSNSQARRMYPNRNRAILPRTP